MKRIFIIFLLILLLPINAFAEESISPDDVAGMEEAKNIINGEDNKIFFEDEITTETVSKLSFGKILSNIANYAKSKINEPARLFASLVGISVLCAVLNAISDTAGSEISKTYKIIGLLCAATVLISTVGRAINEVSETITLCGNFINAYVPVFSSVLAVGGNIATAGVYNVSLLAAANIFTQIGSNFCIPLMGCYLALSVVSGINEDLHLDGLASTAKTIAVWALGLFSTVFVGLLSIQGIVAKSADSVALKTSKFALSSFVPIVGNALSEALSSVEGSIGVIKAGVGSFGIIAGVATILPTLITAVLAKAAVEAARVVSEILGVGYIASLYKSVGAVLTVLIAILLCVCLILLVATTVILLICTG